MYREYDEGPEFADEPVSGWIFNDHRDGIEYRTDLHPSECGLIAYMWSDMSSYPNSEGHFEKYRRRDIYATEAEALIALSARFRRKIKRSEGFLRKIEKRLAALAASGGQSDQE